MQIEHSIIALWIICSMLACWAFSLIVRWCSDARARKLDRLNTQYSPRSRWLAGTLVCICVLGSVLAGYSAAWISARPNIGGVRLTPLGAIGIGMAMFACLLIVWGAIGDRARGRMRCPRCWYDMRDSNWLPCPECGKEVQLAKQLYRTRRPRWAFVVALLFLMVGGTGIGLNAKLRNQGWSGFVPDRILLANWERFPKSWVHDVGAGVDQHDLTERITSGEVSPDDRRAFVTRLIDEMINDPLARWEPRRMALMDACALREKWDTTSENAEWTRVWIPEDDRIQRLYVACIDDLLNFIQRSSIPMDPEHEFAILDSLGMWRGTTLHTTREWTLLHAFSGDSEMFVYRVGLNADQVDHLTGLLGDLPHQFENLHDTAVYTGPDQQFAYELSEIELEIGVLRRRVPELMRLHESNLDTKNMIVFSCITRGVRTIPEDELDEPISIAMRWLADGDVQLRRAALIIFSSALAFDFRHTPVLSSDRANELIIAIRTHALDDQRPAMEGDDSHLISDQALGTIGAIDADGQTYFQLLREAMLDPMTRDATIRYARLDLSTGSGTRVLNWIETFEPLIRDGHPDVRLWIARQIPHRPGSEHDDRLDAMTRVLMQDPNEEVRDQGITRAMDRGIM
jgi:hypothetical protein